MHLRLGISPPIPLQIYRIVFYFTNFFEEKYTKGGIFHEKTGWVFVTHPVWRLVVDRASDNVQQLGSDGLLSALVVLSTQRNRPRCVLSTAFLTLLSWHCSFFCCTYKSTNYSVNCQGKSKKVHSGGGSAVYSVPLCTLCSLLELLLHFETDLCQLFAKLLCLFGMFFYLFHD